MTLASLTHHNINSKELNPMAIDENQAKLLTEQINRLKDLIEARFQKMEQLLQAHCVLEDEKFSRVWSEFKAESDIIKDHENRIRHVDDLVIESRAGMGLIQAAQAALTLIAASIAAWLGGRR
jgi:hypothetical protein